MKHESCLGDTGSKSGLHCRILPNQNGLGRTWRYLPLGHCLGKVSLNPGHVWLVWHQAEIRTLRSLAEELGRSNAAELGFLVNYR